MSRNSRRALADPDEVRMSFGDHLEELRKRIIWALVGLVLCVILCLRFGSSIIEILVTPYTVAMEDLSQDARLVQINPLEGFMQYFKICLEFGLVLAAPWILYQLWLFVASGLYPSERRIVRYFAPASIGLFLTGATFMILIVLSGLIKFLISIAAWFPMPDPNSTFYRFLHGGDAGAMVTTRPIEPLVAPVMEDPAAPSEGQVWLNPRTRRLNVHHNGENYYSPLQPAGSRQIVQPFFSVAEYLGFVTNLALAFGLGFQIPIIVVFLIAMRITEASQISASRRYVAIGLLIASAIITPTPDVGTMLLLALPMLLLFEAGLVVGRIIEKRGRAEDAATATDASGGQ